MTYQTVQVVEALNIGWITATMLFVDLDIIRG